MRPPQRTTALLLVALLLPYAALRLAVATAVPWRPAFDDFFYLPETLRWLDAGALGDDGVFRRVPLWNLLLAGAFALLGPNAGLVALQSGVVLAAAWLGARAALRSGLQPLALAGLPLAILLWSPQLVLYPRQAVNELLVGVLVMAIVALSGAASPRRAFAMGLLAGLAAMTKLVAATALVAAAGYLLAERRTLPLRRSLPGLLAGFALGAAPLAALAMLSRGSLLLDDTAAYNLGALPLETWRALGSPEARHAAGLAAWRDAFAADPGGYLLAAAGRLVGWLARPSSADFAFFYAGYPQAWIEALDLLAFVALLGLAALGSRRRDLGTWLFFALLALACSFPPLTPATPKLIPLFAAAVLAPRGLLRLRQAYIERR